MDLLEHVQRARDRLVVGRMHAPRPAVLHQDAHHLLELAFHLRRHVGPRLAEVLEVRGGEHQHLAGAVVAEVVVALLVGDRLRPVEEVFLLLSRLLGEQVVGQADRQLAGVGQLLDDLVVLGIVLEATARVDRAGDAQPVELAHEVARAVELVLRRELRPLGQRRVQDGRVGLGQQQAGGVARAVAQDLAAGRLGRVAGVADGAQRRAVQQRAVVEVQDEDRRVRRDGIELVDGRQPLLMELVLGEAAHHAHPLRRRRDLDLRLEHRHRVGEAAHAVPAQLHVEVQAAADDVQVVVDQARQHAAAFQVDAARRRAGQRQDLLVAADAEETSVLDGDRLGARPRAVQRREAAVEQHQVGRHARGAGEGGVRHRGTPRSPPGPCRRAGWCPLRAPRRGPPRSSSFRIRACARTCAGAVSGRPS